MKYTILSAALAGSAAAFPAAITEAVAENPEKFQQLAKRLNGIAPGFDASKQAISITGEHKWVAPGPTDQRGPCPGLNAFANHGYIPHNGMNTYVSAVYDVVY